MPHSAQKVYFIHGWGVNHHIFDYLIPQLPNHWEIHALDLPGYGHSPGTESFNVAQIAHTFAEQIDQSAHILGWSLGGLVALHLAAQFPEKIKSLCLTASFAKMLATDDYPEGLSKLALGKMVTHFQQDYAKHIKQFLQLQLLNTPNANNILTAILPNIIRHGVPNALQASLEAVEHEDARPLLPKIQVPTLLIFGKKDAITPTRTGKYLHHHLPNSHLHLIEKAAHAPFISHVDEFANLYTQFIETV